MSSPLKTVDINKSPNNTNPRFSDYEDKTTERRNKLESIKNKIGSVKLKLQTRLAEALGVSLEEFLENKDAIEELKDSLYVFSLSYSEKCCKFRLQNKSWQLRCQHTEN